MKKYDVLLIDADGTIMDFDAAEDKALLAACKSMGLRVDEEQAREYKRINAALWRAFERREVTQAELRTLRFSRFLEYLGEKRGAEEMAEAFVTALSLQTDEIEGARDFMREASARVPVVVVTNGIASVQHSRFGLSPLNQFVKGKVISGEVGFAKPDPRMVQAAMEIAGIPGAGALMVGDSLSSDIAVAVAAGVDSCWYNPMGHENTTPHVPTYEVRTLDEVLAWL